MKKLFGYRSFKCLLVGIPTTALGIIIQQSSRNTDYNFRTISSYNIEYKFCPECGAELK